MPASVSGCPVCRAPWPEDPGLLAAMPACPACGRETSVTVFPALARGTPRGALPETVLLEGEATCFHHPQKRAVVPCAECGRFLCALCDVELHGRHLCPGCLETNRRKGRLTELDTHRTLFDSAALLLALLPLLLCWPATFLSAPVAIGLGIFSFYRPGSILRRTRFRSWLAIGLGLLQVTGWALVFLGGFRGAFQ